MGNAIEIEGRGEMQVLPEVSKLFGCEHPLRTMIQTVLTRKAGSLIVDHFENPFVARLSVGCYEILGGNPETAGAIFMIDGIVPEHEVVYGNDPKWRKLLFSRYGTRLADKTMSVFKWNGRPANKLRASFMSAQGLCEIVEMDELLCKQLDSGLAPHALQVFASPLKFLASGFGFGAVISGRLVSVSTTYGVGPMDVEVSIATRPSNRHSGFARAVAARLVLECLNRGLTPRWHASNPISKHIALELGFVPCGICEALWLKGADR